MFAVVLRGEGDRAFSAGGDLKDTAARIEAGGNIAGDENARAATRMRAHPVVAKPGTLRGFDQIYACSKPTVAAIDGYAMGGGLENALYCDIRPATRQSVSAMPEPKRNLPSGPAFVHLSRMIPPSTPPWPNYARTHRWPCSSSSASARTARNGRRGRRVLTAMTTTRQAGGASPVDFATFGDYGDFRRKQPQPATGEFVRSAYPFRGRITADGSSGYPAVAGRYHLYISWACPWAHRTAIVRRLLDLQEAVSLSAVDPVRDGRGWAFREGPGHSLDPVNGFSLLREAYEATEPGYDGHISVPVLWDRQTGRIVSNNFPDITIDLDTQFGAFSNGTDLYPEALRPEIDAINAVVYETVNNGVYRSGMATSQEAYHDAVSEVFATLDRLEQRLAGRRYLLGDTLTEADVRLWVTLARFDAVYHYHFKVNLRRLTDYPNLWGYARDLYSMPAFRDTTNFGHIKRHYYTTHPHINPTRIVPDGPLLDWTAPHDRGAMRPLLLECAERTAVAPGGLGGAGLRPGR